MMEWKQVITDIVISGDPSRVRITVRGRVQGVGFRPAVYRLAAVSDLGGFVRNTRAGVVIELEGTASAIGRFGKRFSASLPPLARIDHVELAEIETRGETVFSIEASDKPGSTQARYPVDTATCADCLAEMRDPADRRYRYPFINCTNCGPRFSIIEALPYDRPFTTMCSFAMDTFCQSQYTDPSDRRFHAEPISCSGCGPHLRLVDGRGAPVPGDPVLEAQGLIAAGAICAVKGLGGYHLACLATDAGVVELLRRRKKRPAKPFALMFRDLEVLERHCLVDDVEREQLLSPEAPIVLLKKRDGIDPRCGIAEAVAPGNAYIGAFLPYTPVHHLLMESFDVLVMTSANFTDEPLISNEEELSGVLGQIADAALVHDRRIAHRIDDSIHFVPGGSVVPVRRARGFVPEPVPLVRPSKRSILALGGHEKGTFALTRDGQVYISPHLGDLGDFRSQSNYRRELEDFMRILQVRPEACVCDLHPDYFTTRFARELDLPVTIGVQHHHAHAVSVMTEHHLDGPVIGVSFDGTGYGDDGTLWGGEILLADYTGFKRLAHLACVPLPGGEAAVREPWRMALMYMWNMYGDRILDEPGPSALFKGLPAEAVLAMAKGRINSPLTSSIGRLFDAVAFIAGCGDRVSYEAQAAVALEALAVRHGPTQRSYEFSVREGEPVVIEPALVMKSALGDLEAGVSPNEIAAAFHNGVAECIAGLACRLARRAGCRDIVFSGGVFQNRFLVERLLEIARGQDVVWYQHKSVPPNDGGLSLGQAQIGAAMIEEGSE